MPAVRIDIANLPLFAQDLIGRTANLPRSSLHLRKLSIFGLSIDAWFSDPAYADLCARNIAQTPAGEGAVEITLFLIDAQSTGSPAPARWGEDVFDRAAFNEALASAGLHGAYLHDPRVWQFFSPAARTGVQMIREPGATPDWETGGPLRVFLHWAVAMNGARLCHAATLGHDGKGVLLSGAGGSGKSGTTLAGIAGGLTTVGDDYCLLTQGDGDGASAYPLYRILKQDPAGVARALGPVAASRFGALNWQGKYEIHAPFLHRSPFVDRLAIKALLLPRVAHAARSELRPVSAGAAMRAFAPSSVFQLPDDETQGIQFAARLCRHLPCYELFLSEDAEDIAGTIKHFIEELPE
ncbi:serine kinase [Parvibaculum sedimenti]|uniref:Serine kinase n=1 Tax=Parvibaculum sedimenti TaxID=2608632 RepID=A0A6N6VEP6_9HYPH|nr:serine kinase [Parvibaculum sedimenti]KAB7739177.1 serine kinase [Parvibaculum sedimenti]